MQARVEFHGQPHAIVLGKSCAIVLAIDDGIAMQATLALERSSDDGVRRFAQRMLDEHGDHVRQTTDVLAALDVMDLDNPVAASLRAEADASVAELSASTAFDVDYLRSQVTDHSAALVLVVGIDRYLAMPSDTTIRWFDDTESMLREHRADAVELFDARR
ncbi:MAG TPA: DUF4142 domain-containing protein [Kofleriaceae bacterium]|nr:DUF4142 domain-containing protein [Kofleriaceae bacterium]